MRDHTHSSPVDSEFCAHCGQRLPQLAKPYGQQGNNKFGLTVTVVLHLLLVLLYLLRDQPEHHARPPNGATMVMLAPLAGKKSEPKAAPRNKAKALPKVDIQRLPNTITLPNEIPVPPVVVEPKPITPPAVDMQALVEARRRAREQANGQSEQAVQETEGERALRIAKANIAAANGRSAGDDPNETGGVFGVNNKTFSSAELKFRGWNPNFKRRWLQQVTVELGTEVDIETAIVKKMIEIIRKERPGDFPWDSQRLHRVVQMSARKADEAELQAFLMKEMFPEYRPARR